MIAISNEGVSFVRIFFSFLKKLDLYTGLYGRFFDTLVVAKRKIRCSWWVWLEHLPLFDVLTVKL